MPELTLGLPGFQYDDLRSLEGLERLDQLYLDRLGALDPQLRERLIRYRGGAKMTTLEASELLIACAPLLDELIGELFNIREMVTAARETVLAQDPVFQFKKLFVLRRARRKLTSPDITESFAELDAALGKRLTANDDRELAVARHGAELLKDETANAAAIEQLTRWCVQAIKTPEGQAAVAGWVSFRLPQGTDFDHLVPCAPPAGDTLGRVEGPLAHRRHRDGFALTDARCSQREALNEINYCIYCHDHDGDFCSKGFPEKKGEPDKGLKSNPLGVTLTGCPLDEKISEMHLLKKQGYVVAPLAMITVDNPMCAATGHRICNDCMKACIYQKQDPVNIPQTETRVLTDVLNLPWGVEIYDLLIRWNPLRARQWLPKPYTGLKALVLGMGPAGFTLSHHLLMEGFAVVGADGLKIEPLPAALLEEPIRDFDMLTQSLDERTMSGFGGVAEYGITNRWDKNFLRVIYLSLARRAHFQVFGGVRFGGTLTVENAWALGFDHIAICIGAGLPQALPIPGSLAPGMRQANDFLMALQLSGAAKRDSLANLQVRLPAVVVGGGLTGIDAATEVQAYYLVQIEKLLVRFETLAKAGLEETLRTGLDVASLAVLDEMLAHARLVRAERERAAAAGRAPELQKLLQSWGGVTVAYRRGMKDSPAYTRNHEEIIKAFEEGIYYAEGLDPKVAKLDASGHVESLVCRLAVKNDDGKWVDGGKDVVLPARAVLVATGARPNVAYEFEHRGHFAKDGAYYQSFKESDGALAPAPVTRHGKTDDFGAFTSYQQDGRLVSYLGDTHPVFNGSVVRAVASAQRTYPKIVAALGERAKAQGDSQEYQAFRRRMHDTLTAQVLDVTRLAPSVIELTVRAPLAAQRFAPGQFFRVQTFETHAAVVDGTRLQTETVALYGSKVDVEAGTVSLIVIERGASTRLFSTLRAGDPIVLMGPTGVKTTIPEQPETFLFVGDALAAAQVRCVGPALRAAGHRVLLALEFDRADDLFCQDELEAASDALLWVTKQGETIKPRRASDRAASGEMVEALAAYAKGELAGGAGIIRLEDVSKILIVGTSCLVRHMRDARKGALAPYLVKKPATTGSISTPVQCGLKGVCSQCLQWQVDPASGQRTKAVFGCSWQDQPIDLVDMDNLDERLGQNRLLEHLSALWLDHLLDKHKIERV